MVEREREGKVEMERGKERKKKGERGGLHLIFPFNIPCNFEANKKTSFIVVACCAIPLESFFSRDGKVMFPDFQLHLRGIPNVSEFMGCRILLPSLSFFLSFFPSRQHHFLSTTNAPT